MKFTLDVECTPDEARQCLGLPSVTALQERLLKQIEARMQENLSYLDPEMLLRAWFPMPSSGWTEMQKLFWSQMGVKLSSKDE